MVRLTVPSARRGRPRTGAGLALRAASAAERGAGLPPRAAAVVAGGGRRRSDRVGVLPQAADSKREQFRRYLEKSGVLDTLTKGKSPARVVPPAGGSSGASAGGGRSPRGVPLPRRSCRPGTAVVRPPLGLPRRSAPAPRLGEPVALSPQSAWRPAAELARATWCGSGSGVGAGRRGGARWGGGGGAGGLSGNVACEPPCVQSLLAVRAFVARGSIARGVCGTGVVERRKGQEGGSFPLPWRVRPLLLGQSAFLYACFWKQLNLLGAVVLPEL